MAYTLEQFGATVRNDYVNRRRRNDIFESKSIRLSASAALETRAALGHPAYEHLEVGDRRTDPMVAVFLDLSNFTRRTFWDEQEEAADLAHAVLTGFIDIVLDWGGFPLGLRGDGLFAGFSPGDPAFAASMALGACGYALEGVQQQVNPWLDLHRRERVQARAGLDYGPITFVRTGNHHSSEINPIGFAANFAAKCEKVADSWEIVVGEGLVKIFPSTDGLFVEHDESPKRYTRDGETRLYRLFDYRWRSASRHLPGVTAELHGRPTSSIYAS